MGKIMGHKPKSSLPVSKLPTKLASAPTQRDIKVEQLRKQVKELQKTIKGL